MSKIHAWRASSRQSAILFGIAFTCSFAIDHEAGATQRGVDPNPLVFAQSSAEPLPQITANKSLVNISPMLAPAPELFDGKGRATWDGRRTLRGVWVAHPLAQTARRVRIYNMDNGAVVDGALFKRDPSDEDNSLIISSDAATKLGLEPKTPSRLRIVAVRPADTIKKTADAEPIKPRTEPTVKETPKVKISTGDPAPERAKPKIKVAASTSGEVAAPRMVENLAVRATGKPPIPVARPTRVAGSDDSDKLIVETTSFKFESAEKDRLAKADPSGSAYFKKSPSTDATTTVEGKEVAGFVVGALETTNDDVPTKPVVKRTANKSTVDKPAPTRQILMDDARSKADIKATKDIAVSPEKPVSTPKRVTLAEPKVNIAIPARPNTPNKAALAVAETKAKVIKTAVTPTERPKRAVSNATKSKLTRPFVQAGLFGVESNAKRLIKKLKAQGIPARSKRLTSGEKTYLRVLAGPFRNQSSLEKAQKTLRKMGMSDALPVKG